MGHTPFSTSIIEIDRKALRANLALYSNAVKRTKTSTIKQTHTPIVTAPRTNRTKLGAVVKGNAYGHGLIEIGKLLDSEPSISYLFTHSTSEALQLRKNGIQKLILCMGTVDSPIDAVVRGRIDVAIHDANNAMLLSEEGLRQQTRVPIHLKIDSGLSRLGVPDGQALQLATTIQDLPGLKPVAIFSHLGLRPPQFPADYGLRLRRFRATVSQIRQIPSFAPCWLHAGSTYHTYRGSPALFDMVRVGSGLYGLTASEDSRLPKTKPILSWKSRIIHAKEIRAREYVGYNCGYRSRERMKIGIVPVGFCDGYPASLGNRGIVLIDNKPAKIVGNIYMNMLSIDITESEAHVGTEVKLIGPEPEICLYRLSELSSRNPLGIATSLKESTQRRIV